MINKILDCLSSVSLSQSRGKFLSDKSYAYDDIYFMSKFIEELKDDAECFDKTKQRDRFIAYIKDIFQLTGLASGAVNYMIEALNLLDFAGVIAKLDENRYRIVRPDILKYLTERVENCYIFVYLVVYQTFVNDGLLNEYKSFVDADNNHKLQHIKNIFDYFVSHSVSIGGRGRGGGQWSKQLVKYPINVLGFANQSDCLTRTLTITTQNRRHSGSTLVNILDISINIPGTRTDQRSTKINDYIDHFDFDYVRHNLKRQMVVSFDDSHYHEAPISHIAEDLADLKIQTIIMQTDIREYRSRYEQERYSRGQVRRRNSNIQREFKNKLLEHNAHKCPICGFEYVDFLVGAHIVPYAKCDCVYDAINQFNGFLMCPNHDKLFEGANEHEILMTIDANTGKIVLSNKAKRSRDYGHLDGQYINRFYIESERRHYLREHNKMFLKANHLTELP